MIDFLLAVGRRGRADEEFLMLCEVKLAWKLHV